MMLPEALNTYVKKCGNSSTDITDYDMIKIMASWGSRRIPEAVLLLIGLCGGATGGYISMRLFRHKTRKPLFVILMPILMLLQLGLFIWW